jgi:hypothetical protein
MNIPYSLILAITSIESGGNPAAVGRNGELGILQIQQGVVDDCNRLQSMMKFTHADALRPECAEAMFRIYVRHYASRERLGYKATIQEMAMIWNGGPSALHKYSSLEYASRAVALARQYEREQPALNTITGFDWQRMFARDRAGLNANPIPAQLRAALFPTQ